MRGLRFELVSRAVLAGLLGLSLSGVCGCSKHEAPRTAAAPSPEMKQAPPTPITEKKAELGGTTWDPSWDAIVEQALPPTMLSREVPRDVRRFCPRFYEMADVDKRAFWAYFFQALAGAEAGLDPTTRVQHTERAVAVKDDVTKRRVRSEGLLQLTYEDQERYGCDFDWERDRKLPARDTGRTILQPKNNLECGVKILERQIIGARKPLLSRSGYWSTLRPGGPSYRAFAKQMTNPPAACGFGERAGAGGGRGKDDARGGAGRRAGRAGSRPAQAPMGLR